MKYAEHPTDGRILGRLTFQSFFDEKDLLELYITDGAVKEGLDIHLDKFLYELCKYLKEKKNEER